MKTPLIVNELTYADNDGTTVSRIDLATHLKKGAIAFFDEDGNLIAANASSISGKLVNAVVGLGNGKIFNINSITRSTFNYTLSTSAQLVNKTMIVGGDGSSYSLNLPSPIPAGSTAIVRVHNITQLNDTRPYDEYVVPVAVGASATQIVNAIVAVVNADTNAIVSAAAKATNKGITFVGTKGFDFKITCSGVLADADILEYKLVNNVYTSGYASSSNVVEYVTGNATYAQMIAAENYSQYVRAGRYDTYNDEMSTPFYLTDKAIADGDVSGVTYKQANCTYYDAPYMLKKSDDYINELTIYYTTERTGTPAATDSLAAIENILSKL